jgi:hypothetical protein
MALDILDVIIVLLPIAIIAAGGMYQAFKKLIIDLAEAIRDDEISKDELILLIQDSIGFINVIKHAVKGIIDFIMRR